MTMKYSVVIISKNNRELLINSIKNLLRCIPKDTEIVVVESISPFKDFPFDNIKYIYVEPSLSGFSIQRNIGVMNATGDYVIFIDDDVEVNNDWFKSLTEPIVNNNNIIGGMGAVFPKIKGVISFITGVLGHPGGGFRLHYYSRGKMIPLSQVATCNTIIKKSVIVDVGHFDLKNKYGSEDTDLSIRITHKYGKNRFIYIPNAQVWHYSPNNIKRYLKWYIRRGKADADLFLKHTVHLNYLVSSSISLKIVVAVALGVLISWKVLFAIFLVWYGIQLYRARFMFRYFHVYNFNLLEKILIFFIFPVFKMIADIMFDLGRVLRICEKLKGV